MTRAVPAPVSSSCWPGNLHLGRPEHVEIIFGRKVTSATPGVVSTRVLNRPGQVTVNFSFRHSRIKIYLGDHQ